MTWYDKGPYDKPIASEPPETAHTRLHASPPSQNRHVDLKVKLIVVFFAAGAIFFFGEWGVLEKANVKLRAGYKFPRKKRILRKLTVHTIIVLIYLSTLSTKDFAKINKITMVTPFAGSYLLINFFDDSIKNSTSTQRPNFNVFLIIKLVNATPQTNST